MVPATVVSVVLIVVGVLAAISAVTRLVTGSWPAQVDGPARTVGQSSWGSVPVIAGAVVLVIIGLVLLIAGLKAGAFRAVELARPPGGRVEQTDYVISTRAMARLAAAQADTVDGVADVSASASGRRVHLSVTTESEHTSSIRERVVQVVSHRLDAAGVSPAPKITATVRTRGI